MGAVYKGMDEEFLEAEYNLLERRGADSAAEVIQDWTDRSARYREESGSARIDLAYGEGDRDKLDWFFGGDVNGPLLVYIHGGYWQRGDKSMYSFIAESFVRYGVSVAVLNYNLTPSVRIGEIPPQIRQAISWLWQHAPELGFSRELFHISGHSAGGQLTAMMMATNWSDFDGQLPAELVRAGIPISGVFELEPLVHTSINDVPAMSLDEARRESPSNITPATNAPQLVAVGGGESGEFLRQADAYADQYRSADRKMERLDVLVDDHFDILNTLASDDSEFFARCMALINA